MKPIVIATRGSELALWQANFIKASLSDLGISSTLKIIKTQGDEVQHLSLHKLEGKGFFTKEIEDALLANEADIAVHSHKDLPTASHPDLMIAAVTEREDPSELLISKKESVDVYQRLGLKKSALVGTSSARRQSQLLAFRPDLTVVDLRGNVPTRIQKLRDGNYDAILLAAAGVERLALSLDDLNVQKLNVTEFLPAPAQGALAIQIRKSDSALANSLSKLHHQLTATLINAERQMLQLFKGGCHEPLGAYALYDDENEKYILRACHAATATGTPASAIASSNDITTLAERVYKKITQHQPTSVFITRNERKNDYFFYTLKNLGYQVIGQTLIEMRPINFSSFADTEWIFFSSKNAVTFFFGQKPILKNQLFGCIAKNTADELRKHGHRATFIGSSTDTRLTAKQFAAKAGHATVLFPQAKGSMRTVQQQFVRPQNAIDLNVYETIHHALPENISSQILLFTSPSNVDSFLATQMITKQQKVIAMGQATAAALQRHNINVNALSDTFDDTGLVRAVIGLE